MKCWQLQYHSNKMYASVLYQLTLSQTSHGFMCLYYKTFENTVGKGEIARNEQFLLFPVFSNLLENFHPFSSSFKLSSAISSSLEESKICRLGKGFKMQNKTIHLFKTKPWFLCVCSTSLLKTPWKKDKLLITSNFSFTHYVFYLSEEHFAIFIKSGIFIWERVNKTSKNFAMFSNGYKMRQLFEIKISSDEIINFPTSHFWYLYFFFPCTQ